MKIPFAKVESVGNDFVLIESAALAAERFAAFASAACERRYGIGSDGLLTVEKVDDATIAMRMFNPDGTEDFCGNGLRCAALYAHAKGWTGERFDLLHGDQRIPVSIMGGQIRTTMGPASFEPSDIPIASDSEFFRRCLCELAGGEWANECSAVTTGSAHLVIECDAPPSEAAFQTLAPILERHPLFPQRTSAIWAWRGAEGAVEVRIWERGVGETLGCGTGSAAVVAVLMRRDAIGGTFPVRNPGGLVVVEGEGVGSPLSLTGTATIPFEGEFPFDC